MRPLPRPRRAAARLLTALCVIGLAGESAATSVVVSPDGLNVYTTGGQTLAGFDRDPATGLLTLLETFVDGQDGIDSLADASSVTVSPDNEYVYVASFGDDSVTVFDRDPATGLLTLVEVEQDGVGGVDGLAGAASVVVSPDNLHVYVASGLDDAVAVFSRDVVTGELTFVETQVDGVGGVEGLGGAVSVTVSPDGLSVYVAGFTDSAVAVFSRDVVTGALTFVEAQSDGVGGVDGLAGASFVQVSDDNANVYVTGFADDAVAIFDRDLVTGALTFSATVVDEVGGVVGLDGPTSLAIRPPDPLDATIVPTVYVGSCIDAAVVEFTRDVATGLLTFEGTVTEDFTGVQYLALSPDFLNLYVVDRTGLAIFSLAADGTLTPEESGLQAGESFGKFTAFSLASGGSSLINPNSSLFVTDDGVFVEIEITSGRPDTADAAPATEPGERAFNQETAGEGLPIRGEATAELVTVLSGLLRDQLARTDRPPAGRAPIAPLVTAVAEPPGAVAAAPAAVEPRAALLGGGLAALLVAARLIRRRRPTARS